MSNGITRFNPMREMATMQSMMDRLFEDWRPFIDDSRTTNALALDVHEDDKSYVISTELPGVKPDDIHVRQEGEYLVIEAETRDESETEGQEGRRTLIRERRLDHVRLLRVRIDS